MFHRYFVVDLSNISRFFLRTHAFSIIKHKKIDSTAQLVVFNAMVTAPDSFTKEMILHTEMR